MGHKNDDVFAHYVSNTSGVDVQNVINNREPDQILIDYVRSMQAHIDHNVPLRDRSLLTDVVRRRPEPLNYAAQREEYLAREDDIFEGTEAPEPFQAPSCQRRRSRFFDTYLLYNKPRARFIGHLPSAPDCKQEHLLREVLPDLVELSLPEEDWAYPTCKPSKDYACRICGLEGQRK
jgi:hypothetical protein